ncbi:hypothetical protein PACTADRAFT_185387 [Pachysolen tannophilus NRRL Y-2460]|uniref:SWR1-complex protein 3 n=1 Tax=Pachysolen tannophilus NRRL Y-2460 TaxID=669874 RepID=A0A1E4U2F2_PACTA|nr:hypothetical protein PACTADRAFT_185387 [Pachysolen tannophilus NRRL Y-2460]
MPPKRRISSVGTLQSTENDDSPRKRGRPLNSTRVMTELQKTTSLANLELDLPSIDRPFKVSNSLPVSVEEPVYDELGDDLLSIKDSATLYNSLIISRQNWLYNDESGIFKPYWSKKDEINERNGNDNDKEEAKKEVETVTDADHSADHNSADGTNVATHTKRREKLIRLCEPVIQLGPHFFDLRLFLMKDNNLEKQANSDTSLKREEVSTDNVQKEQKDAGENGNEVVIKSKSPEVMADEQKQETSNNVAQDESKTQHGQQNQEPDSETMSGKEAKTADVEEDKSEKVVETEGVDKKTEVAKEENKEDSKEQNESKEKTEDESTKTPEVENGEKTTDKIESEAKVKTPEAQTKEPSNKDGEKTTHKIESETKVKTPEIESKEPTKESGKDGDKTADKVETKEKAKTPGEDDKGDNKGEKKSEETTANKLETEKKEARKPQKIMQTLENYIMISNLNALARANSALNDLMKIVASGSASHEQIVEFQGYIHKAKAKGDPTGELTKIYRAQSKKQKQEKKLAEREKKQQEKLKKQLEKQKEKDKIKEQKRLEKEKLKESKSQVKNATKKSDESKPKPKPVKKEGKKLTPLQEKYCKGATLIFEFVENTSVRYFLPKECIIELLDNGDYLLSFMWVHNQDDVDKYENWLKEKQEKEKEKEVRIKMEDEAHNNEEEVNGEKLDSSAPESQATSSSAAMASSPPNKVTKRSRRKGRNRRFQKPKLREKEVTEEKKEDPELVKPVPIYSSVTAKLINIPDHLSPIIANSADDLESVQKKMKNLIENGVRYEQDYVWYQLDGINDEILSEQLRSNLITLENQTVKKSGHRRKRI